MKLLKKDQTFKKQFQMIIKQTISFLMIFFTKPKKNKTINEDLLQKALNKLTRTDDHRMQIIGLAKDQMGKECYMVKNYWGVINDLDGYLYITIVRFEEIHPNFYQKN